MFIWANKLGVQTTQFDARLIASFVERRGQMGIQVVHDQHDLIRGLVFFVQGVSQREGPIHASPLLGYPDMPVAAKRFAEHENVARAATLVFRVVTQRLPIGDISVIDVDKDGKDEVLATPSEVVTDKPTYALDGNTLAEKWQTDHATSMSSAWFTKIDCLGSDAPMVGSGSTNSPVSVAAAFSDPGWLDTHAAVVDWGDGSANVRITTTLDGGAGNDFLNGGGGSNILLGGIGNDMLLGGCRRDILIGGEGSDRLVANGDEDILVGGKTDLDPDEDALAPGFDRALLNVIAEWNARQSYASGRLPLQLRA